MGAAWQKEMIAAGARAPDFQLEVLAGGQVGLQDILAKGPALLAFFKISCPVCQMTFPYLERIHQGGMAIYGISQDEPEDTREFNATFGVTFPTLLDRERNEYPASNAYSIAHVPSLFFVEADGTVSWTLEGFGRKDLETLAERAGVTLFRPEERVPEWQSG